MNKSSKTGANLQHQLSTSVSAQKIPFSRQQTLLELEESKRSLVTLNKRLKDATAQDRESIKQELEEGLELLEFVLNKIKEVSV